MNNSNFTNSKNLIIRGILVNAYSLVINNIINLNSIFYEHGTSLSLLQNKNKSFISIKIQFSLARPHIILVNIICLLLKYVDFARCTLNMRPQTDMEIVFTEPNQLCVQFLLSL